MSAAAEPRAEPTPPLEAFRLVDSAIGGAHNRNRVIDIATFMAPAGARDVFTTMFRYPDAILDHLAVNRNAKGELSVSGYNGPAYAPRLVMDFDAAHDLAAALRDVIAVVHRLGERYDVPPGAIRVRFTGAKGFSLELPGALFGGFEPMPARDLAAHHKRLARTLAAGLATLDPSIYDPVRLIRVDNTINGKSGLYKVPLTIPELLTLDIPAIRELATQPRDGDAAPDAEWDPIPELVALWEETRRPEPARSTSPSEGAGELELSADQITQAAAILAPAYTEGQRHELALATAGWLAKQEYCQASVEALIERLAASDPELPDRLRAVETTFAKVAAGQRDDLAGWDRLNELLPGRALKALELLIGTEPHIATGPHRMGRNGASAGHDDQENTNNANSSQDAPPAVEPFPVRVLPPAVRAFVASAAASIGCPADYVAVPLLGLAEGCIGKSRRLVIRPGFEVSPGSWFGVVGESGTGKSPALKRALQVIRPLQDEAWTGYLDKLAHWESLSKEERGDKPAPEHFYVTDSTGEALWAALASSAGVAQVEDELRRRLKALDAYRQAGDRQAMLAMWSNAPVKIVRRTSAPVYIPFPVAPLIGGIQPGVLRHLRGEGEDADADDGWVPRFLLCWPDAEPLDLSDVPFDETTQPPIVEIFRRLRLYNKEPYDTVLSDAAFARFREWHGDNRHAQLGARGFERQWAAKAPTHLARLALVLHLFASPPATARVSVETMDAAIELVEYFRDHLTRVLPAFGAAATSRLHARITRIIRTAEPKAEGGWVARTTVLDKLRNVAPEALTAALTALEGSGRVESRRVATPTKPREEWRITSRHSDNHAGGNSGYSGYSASRGENPNNPNTRNGAREWETWTV